MGSWEDDRVFAFGLFVVVEEGEDVGVEGVGGFGVTGGDFYEGVFRRVGREVGEEKGTVGVGP